MEVYHITSIERAISIVWPRNPIMNGIFEPNTFEENDGDYGINLFQESKKYCAGQPKHSGCKIIFEYEGDTIKYVNLNVHPKTFEQNTLYDQSTWRMFIKGPITKDILKVKRLEFDESVLKAYVESNKKNAIQRIFSYFDKGSRGFKDIESFKILLDKHIINNNIYIIIGKKSIF